MIVLTRRKTNILSRSKRLIEASKSSISIKFLQLIILKAMLIPFLLSKVLEHTPFETQKDFLILECDHFLSKPIPKSMDWLTKQQIGKSLKRGRFQWHAVLASISFWWVQCLYICIWTNWFRQDFYYDW